MYVVITNIVFFRDRHCSNILSSNRRIKNIVMNVLASFFVSPTVFTNCSTMYQVWWLLLILEESLALSRQPVF